MSKITKKFKISQMIILRNIIDSNFKHPTTKLSLIPANFITYYRIVPNIKSRGFHWLAFRNDENL